MKKTESTTLEDNTTMTEKSNQSAEHFLNELNLATEPGKTQEHKIGEEAEIIHEMDEIIKNNDKFETIRVIMELLCKELEISKESQMNQIIEALRGVTERYYKSMEDWKNLTKQGQKQSIRQ